MSFSANPPPPFSVWDAFTGGVRLAFAHARLFSVLSFLPFVVTLLTLVALRLLGPDIGLFWLPVIQLPSSFVIGLQTALILRFVVFHEYPILDKPAEKMMRNRAVMQSAVVYAAIMYFVTGLFAGTVHLRALAETSPEAVAPWGPLFVAGLILLIWASRWFWLHAPLALHWPVGAFYQRLGRWGGSLRVFLLFAICSVLMNLLATVLRMFILALAGENKEGGFAAAFDDTAIALGTVVLAVLFACCTAAAIKFMMKNRGGPA